MEIFGRKSGLNLQDSADYESKANNLAIAGFATGDKFLIKYAYHILINLLRLPKNQAAAMMRNIKNTTPRH